MTSRTKRKVSTLPTLSNHNRIENSWVMVVKDSLLENDNFKIVTLPHPRHKTPFKYCLDRKNMKMYEIITCNEPHRSWFIGETVKSDGRIMLVTPFNPLFLVLPKLKTECVNRAVPLNDLFFEKGFNEIKDFISGMDSVADAKGSPDIQAYKYNEEKTLQWLESKIRKLAILLRQKNMHVTSGSTSATFVSSSLSDEHIDEEFYLKYSHGIISEYLEDDIVKALEKRFDFKSELIETIGKKRKSDGNELKEVGKKLKSDVTEDEIKPIIGLTSPSEAKKQKPLTAKEKARQKAASGTKTISSFFVKK